MNTILVCCPVGWGCRIHRLLLCRGVRPPPPTSVLIWHQTIWWWGSGNAGALGNAEYPFNAVAPRSTLARSGSTWEDLIYGLNRTNSILMLNWIVWVNWIAWKRNVFDNLVIYGLVAYFKAEKTKVNVGDAWFRVSLFPLFLRAGVSSLLVSSAFF